MLTKNRKKSTENFSNFSKIVNYPPFRTLPSKNNPVNCFCERWSKSLISGWVNKPAFTLAEGATHVAMSDNHRKSAFTLAEVLVTLSIIGVVAAITLPTLITNVNERRNSERQANIAQKITQAMEHMRATGALVKYDSTESFVDELKNHLKINKICYKDNLAECWPTETITDHDGNEYEVANAKTGEDLGIEGRTTNNVGLILADGASIILSYDNTDEGLDIGDRVTASYKDLPVGNNKTKSFPYTTSVTRAVDFVMDVNGKTKPNREMDTNNRYYDIRSFKTAKFSASDLFEDGRAGKILYIGQSYTPIDCRSTNSSNPDYQTYCNYGGHPSGSQNDYWAGALKACKEQSGGKASLPNESKLLEIQQNKADYPSLSSLTPVFWSSDEDSNSPQGLARIVDFYFGGADYDIKGGEHFVVCVK